MRHQVDGNLIRFDRRKLCGLNEYTYPLYCAAKDLYMGTRHLTIRDLADRELISRNSSPPSAMPWQSADSV